MTSQREFNASNVEKALERAASELGTEQNLLSYEIVDKGSDGFLGIGARDARILVEVPETSDEIPSGITEVHEEQEDIPHISEPEDSIEPEDTRENEFPNLEDERVEQRPSRIADEDIERVRKITESFVEAMGFQARIDAYEAEDVLAVDIVSDHTALLIGQKGETLDSLQYLVNSAASQNERFEPRIILDSEGYRQRRVEAIQGMAHRAARKAMREGTEFDLPPMSSAERRVVHLYLEDDSSVRTYSDGTGDRRHVIVAPTD